MNDPSTPLATAHPLCHECGAELPARATHCWLCGTAVASASARPVGSPPSPPNAQPSETHFTFSLSTLFLAMTLIAVLLGLSVVAPGLGIPLFVLAIPTWIRSARAVALEPAEVLRSDRGYQISKFIESLGMMFLVCIAAGAAGFAACSVVCFAGMGLPGNQEYGAFEAGLVAGGFTVAGMFIWLLVKWWPKRKKTRA